MDKHIIYRSQSQAAVDEFFFNGPGANVIVILVGVALSLAIGYGLTHLATGKRHYGPRKNYDKAAISISCAVMALYLYYFFH